MVALVHAAEHASQMRGGAPRRPTAPGWLRREIENAR
jgi:hypothetical protein